jgi:hypothetical protein
MSANRLRRLKSRQILERFFKDYFGDGDPRIAQIRPNDSSREIEEGIADVVGCLHFASVSKKWAFVVMLRTRCNLYRLLREVCPRTSYRSIPEVQTAKGLHRYAMNLPKGDKSEIESLAQEILLRERLKRDTLTWGLSGARSNLAAELDIVFRVSGFMHRWNSIFDLVEATFPSRNSKANISDEEKSGQARQWVYRILKEQKFRGVIPEMAKKDPDLLSIKWDKIV